MAMASDSDSTIDQLRDLCSEMGQLIETLAASRGIPSSHEQSLTSLKAVLQDALSVVHVLHNERRPIHRLPPEVLVRIFSSVRISEWDTTPVGHSPVRWSFTVQDGRELHPLLLVCRSWRDLALNTPLLWSHVMAAAGMDDDYLARSASVPLTLYISSAMQSSVTKLPGPGGGYVSRSCQPSSFYKALKSIGKVHSRIRVLHVNFADSIVSSWLVGYLASLGAHQLEECSIEFPSTRSNHAFRSSHVPDLRPRLTLFSGGWGNRGGEKLRSLRLVGVPFLPANMFPALTTFELSDAETRTHLGVAHAPSWGLRDLADFLSGSPRLETLYMRNVQLESRVSSSSGVKRVALSRLRYFQFEIPLHAHKRPAMQRAFSIIGFPSDCHVLLTTFSILQPDPDALDQLFTSLPSRSDAYTRLRIRSVEDEYTTLHFVPATGTGSLSVCLRVVDQPPAFRTSVKFNPQRELRALFDRAYPWCCAIEELWLELAEDDYCRGLRCVLGRFPSLRRLVVSQPSSLSSGAWYARIADALHLLRPTKSGNVACPALDTLCINTPAYCKDVEAIKQVLVSRARSHPVRRLVVGYSHMLEWEVLSEVFSLEELVEEFVCEELPPVRGDTVLADWLLSIPRVSEEGVFHTSWPMRYQGKHPLTYYLPPALAETEVLQTLASSKLEEGIPPALLCGHSRPTHVGAIFIYPSPSYASHRNRSLASTGSGILIWRSPGDGPVI